MVYPSGGGKLGCHGRKGSGCEMERGEKGKGKGKGDDMDMGLGFDG